MQIKQPKIKSIIINKQYSSNGNCNIVNFNNNGIVVSVDNLSSVRKLSNLDNIKDILDYYPDLKKLNISGSFNYEQILGKPKTVKYNSYLKNQISESINLVNGYHTEIFPIRKKCYQNLNQVFYDGKMLELPKYNHSSVTGRTSIIKGHNFLTMKKSERSKLKPRVKGNALVEVDFKSCEPFFYLLANNFKLDGVLDIYSWISQKYSVELKDRSKFKRGILSMLYGANEYTISKVMQVKIDVVKKIKKELGIDDLKKRLSIEFENNKFIKNYYGRPITSDANLVNYWIQSSAVDFCSLAFSFFCKEQKIRPSFFIHDSMTFEINSIRLEEILKVTHLIDPYSNISIPVEFNVLS